MSEENKRLFRRCVEEGINKHNVDVLWEVYQDCVFVSPGTGEIKGEALKNYMASYLAALAGLQCRVEDQVAEGDKVATRWSVTATHKGEFMGVAPTGKPIKVTGMTVSRILDGKVVEEWEEYDALGMMQQLGAVPPLSKSEGKAAA
jgi:steroid delta-isomerase-like uncharacterized protein